LSQFLGHYQLPVKQVETTQEPFDPSKYLHELALSEWIQEVLLKSWPWEFVECGGGTNTITAQMLHERTDEELLAIPGIGKQALTQIREAVAGDSALNPF